MKWRSAMSSFLILLLINYSFSFLYGVTHTQNSMKGRIRSDSLLRRPKLLPRFSLLKKLVQQPQSNLFGEHRFKISSKNSKLNSANNIVDAKASSTRDIELGSEISWRECSGKFVRIYQATNAKLSCELWAPLGSTVTWRKDGKPVRVHHHPNLTYDNPLQNIIYSSEPNNLLKGLEQRVEERRNYEFHLKTSLHFDCTSEANEGLYTLEIMTPGGSSYSRSFKVITIGEENHYMLAVCRWYLGYSRYFDPRITEFAKTVVGKKGKELTLPCRPQQLQAIEINWTKTDKEITPDNYTINEQGDLRIHHLSPQDKGMFVCQVYHYAGDVVYDQITTFVEDSESSEPTPLVLRSPQTQEAKVA